ncbi:hypothetical protein P344_07155 [Spiroplasma mirum ATCC 29335]|uniref:Uncharacterized protein n=1 Tax=Spiroplasma mirum ATCC 29335 TaxID=838561 RepID=W6ANG6_9MOLU|nr:hypothetical protein P344_07155 [Spiroplasma mirum ATCC 29335]
MLKSDKYQFKLDNKLSDDMLQNFSSNFWQTVKNNNFNF